MIFQEEAQFNLIAPKNEGSEYYEHQLMGEQLGNIGISNQ